MANYLTILIWLFISKLGLFQNTTSPSEAVDIVVDGIIKERWIYDNKKQLIALVRFRKETSGKVVPMDSIRYKHLVARKQLQSFKFDSHKGKYILNKGHFEDSFSESYFTYSKGCNDLDSLVSSYLLVFVKINLCQITGSVLSDGREVMDLRKVKIDTLERGVQKIISYENLNSRFLSLTEFVQSYFFQQPIINLKLVILNNLLVLESYSFSNGSMERRYSYNAKGKIDSVAIKVRTSDTGVVTKLVEVYRYD